MYNGFQATYKHFLIVLKHFTNAWLKTGRVINFTVF